jgi:hypothetical protein
MERSEMKEFKLIVNPYRGGPDDWALRALPPKIVEMVDDAESGAWEAEPNDLLIEFVHEIKHVLTGELMLSSIGFSRLSGEWVLPIKGETALLDGLPIRVDGVKISDEPGECEGGGTYTFCTVAISLFK